MGFSSCCIAGLYLFCKNRKDRPRQNACQGRSDDDRGTTLFRQLLAKLPSLPGKIRACAVTGAPAAGYAFFLLGTGAFSRAVPQPNKTASPAKLRDHVPPCGRRLLSAVGRLSVSRSRRGTLPFTVVGHIDIFYIIIAFPATCQVENTHHLINQDQMYRKNHLH